MAYKKQRNLKDFLVRAKLNTNKTRPARHLSGMNTCGKSCHMCPYVIKTKHIKGDNFNWKVTKQVTCETNNVIYMIQCNKEQCRQQYIGETERKMKVRFGEHKGYVNSNNKFKTTGTHFNLPGHSISNMTVIILEKVKVNQ